MSKTTQISIRLSDRSTEDLEAIRNQKEEEWGRRPSRADVVAWTLRQCRPKKADQSEPK